MKYLIPIIIGSLLIFLVFMLVPNLFKTTVGRALIRLNNTLYKWDYHISAFNVNDHTKIAIVFEKKFNYSCIKSIKIDNKTVQANIDVVNNNILEIDLKQRLRGAHDLEIIFCDRKLYDTIVIE